MPDSRIELDDETAERAAILEFDAGMSRADADMRALVERSERLTGLLQSALDDLDAVIRERDALRATLEEL